MLVWFAIYDNPWLIERNTRERKMLLLMLSDLADEAGAWERDESTWLHKDSSVSFRRDEHDALRLMVPQDIQFETNTKGWRILQRVVEATEREEARQADLAALQSMNEAYKRMNRLQ